jgi:hypothetical protein
LNYLLASRRSANPRSTAQRRAKGNDAAELERESARASWRFILATQGISMRKKMNSSAIVKNGISRRALLKAGAGTAALVAALKTNFPYGVSIAEAAGPETTKANLGFIALTDAAPLFVAKEKGIFA